MNLTDISGFPIGDVGFGSLVVLVIVSIIKGWLVPGRTVKLITTSKDEQIRLLTQANSTLTKANDEQTQQIFALIQHGTTAHVAVTTIAEAATDGRR